MNRDVAVYVFGVACLTVAGFLSPWSWFGFVPLGLGAIWAWYDVIDVEDSEHGDTPRTPRSR